MTHLEKLLTKHATGKTILIVTDGVFSMEGDLAPLPTICQLAQRYDARILVDDAHGTGVMGAQGRGTVEHFKIEERIDFQVGTLGKALGTFGAFLVGSQETRTYLLQKAKSLIYTTALPPAILAASLAALDLVERQPGLRERLWKNRNYYVGGLNGLGYEVMQSETPIVPILVGQTHLATALSQGLFERGIFAPAIRPPTVPKGTSRIRTTVMATHTREQLDDVLEAFADIGKGLGLRG
jgi:glycine C-acetyltransferase/8-amino-7-oxononanoate synthase